MLLSFSFLKVVLKGSKQFTFKGCKAWEVCDNKVIISKPNCCACSITSRLTCEPCPFRVNKWRLLGEKPPRTDLLKSDKNYLNKKLSSMLWFGLPYMFIMHDVIIFYSFTLEYVKSWCGSPCYIHYIVNGQPFFGFKDSVIHWMKPFFCYNSNSWLPPYLNPNLIIIPNVI